MVTQGHGLEIGWPGMGSVASTTMREEDLIPAFIDELKTCLHNVAMSDYSNPEIVKRVGEIKTTLGDIERRMERPGYWGSSDCDSDLRETLFALLDEFSPPYVYFGAHPGDGADYGFWPVSDSI